MLRTMDFQRASNPTMRPADCGLSVSAHMWLIPKLEDPDSCHVRRHWDIHCKNVRWSNGIWAPCSGADGGADESMSPHFSITHLARIKIGGRLVTARRFASSAGRAAMVHRLV
jgi:hypothetical protein